MKTKEQLKEQIDAIREMLRGEIGGSTMDFVEKLVELELQLEEQSNQ